MKNCYVALALFFAFATQPASAADYQTLQRLGNGIGWKGEGGLVEDPVSQTVYGITANSPTGKWHSNIDRGCGSIISLRKGEKATTVHDFTAKPRTGCRVWDGLLFHASALYGSTMEGGAHGHGTLFRLQHGKFEVLHHFSGADGRLPNGELLAASDGYIYGTTWFGGFRDFGTIFRISLAGEFETVYEFQRDDPAGLSPRHGLTQGTDGRIYGTTFSPGTLFVLDERGRPQPLHHFNGGILGLDPTSLTPGSEGSLYGAAFSGGEFGLGMIYRWSAKAGFEHLHSFSGLDGDGPQSPPVLLPDGGLAGTTNGMGLGRSRGTLYRFDLGTGLTILHTFEESPRDGAGPNGKVLIASDGAWYGMTAFGGNEKLDGWGTGTIWRYRP
jgi:uncharacterized repeat protein (TIGR03803 family)